MSRLRLDGALASAARASGAHIVDRWRAVGVERSGDRAFIVDGIDADGRRDRLLARQLVLASGKAERLVRTDGSGPPGRSESTERSGYIAWKAHHLGAGPRDAVELYAFGGGYCGVAPIEGGRVNVCGLATRRAFARAGSSIDGLLDGAMRENPSLGNRLSGLRRLESRYLTAASMSFRRRCPVTSSCLSLGDAAGLIAPLSGDGIGMALSSAALAEEWLASFLQGRINRRAMLAGYGASWRRAFERRLVLASGLQRLLLHPRRSAWALRICRALPPLTGWLVRHTREPGR
jgi:flavin-dependent dehydrogenase